MRAVVRCLGELLLMRIQKVVLFAVVLSFCLFSSAVAQSIRFAPLPMLSRVEMEKDFQPFTHYLNKITSAKVEMIYHKNYQTLLDGLNNDTIDLAYLGPLPYVSLTQLDPSYVPMVRFVDQDGSATYTCSLVSFDSPLQNVRNVIPPIIALTQPQSTCGYLVTEQLLQHSGSSLVNLPYYYTGLHSECALDVLRGKAQFAGLKTSIARQYRNLGLDIVAESAPFPGYLLVANSRTLDGETIAKIQASLLELKPNIVTGGDDVSAPWGKMIRYGAIPVHSSDYDVIRKMVNRVKIPEGDL